MPIGNSEKRLSLNKKPYALKESQLSARLQI